MRKLIRANGVEEDVPTPLTTKSISTLLCATSVDSVTLRHMGRPVHVMMLDDLGHDKGLPVNAKATALYHANCVPGTTHPIVGDVLICPDEDFA